MLEVGCYGIAFVCSDDSLRPNSIAHGFEQIRKSKIGFWHQPSLALLKLHQSWITLILWKTSHLGVSPTVRPGIYPRCVGPDLFFLNTFSQSS